jgi:hypothetical protein
MTEHLTLEALDRAWRAAGVHPIIEAIASRVEERLARDPGASLAWEPVPLATYAGSLPPGIESSWIFVLRAGITSGAERHPNSHQRVMSLRGRGDLQTWDDGVWTAHVLESDAARALGERWLSIPVNVWHKPVMGDSNWVVLSFHTASDETLIEETGDPATSDATHRATYSSRADAGLGAR